MTTAAVTPVIGEFGYLVFDVQPRIRAWLRAQKAERKVVFAPKAWAPFFEEATEIIEYPRELLPTAPATMRSIVFHHWGEGDPERQKVEQLVKWARSTLDADIWLDIPYFDNQQWSQPPTFTQLESDAPAPTEPYIVVAARARAFDAWRNWPTTHWDELIGRIKDQWGMDVYSIGQPPSTYFPRGVIPQESCDAERLNSSISLLNHAVCSISSNSGPTHLSLMAGCPTFAWGEPYLKSFMEVTTNPLRTPCYFHPGGWDPDVDSVWHALCRWRDAQKKAGRWPGHEQHKVHVSMCMIARDSSRTIQPALKSIKPWVDEMIVVDTGSIDDTANLAQACGARVLHAPWRDSFAEARNESVRHAAGRWIFWMDSDDTINEENGRKLKELANQNHSPTTLGYVIQVHCPANSESAQYPTATVVDHVKLFRNIPAINFTGRIHEQLLPAIRQLGCDVEWTNINVTHSGSDRSIEGRAKKHSRDLRLLEMELGENPDSTFNHFNMGMTLLDMGRAEEALNPLCRSLQLAAPGESHIRKIFSLLAQAYSTLKRAETALRTCQQGLMVCPGDPELTFRKGILEQSLGRLLDAEASFRSIVSTEVDRHFSSVDEGIFGVKAWHNLAVIYELLRRYDLASQAWQRVLGFDRANPLAWRGLLDSLTALKDARGLILAETELAELNLGDLAAIAHSRTAVLQGKSRDAIDTLEKAIQSSNGLDVLEELCELSFMNNDLEKAEARLTELVRRRPDDPGVLQNLAAVYLRRHNYNKAADNARRSLSLRPDYPVAKRLLIQAMEMASAADLIS